MEKKSCFIIIHYKIDETCYITQNNTKYYMKYIIQKIKYKR